MFILKWVLFYVSIMFAMLADNIFWISASPEYKKFKRLGWFKKSGYHLKIHNNIYFTKTQYIIKYRIKTVLTHWRDIIPGLITSLILALVW